MRTVLSSGATIRSNTSIALKLSILSSMLVLVLARPILGADFNYREYAKASESWRRGFVFGISQYMSAVAQPDEEPPYPAWAPQRTVSLSGTSTNMLQPILAALMGR